ncbi:MAG: hypothetical protein Q9167_008136, partial [Letrouitia subvulpina]
AKVTYLGGVLHPQDYFSKKEKAVFRNMLSHKTRFDDPDDKGWYNLPGPAWWWAGYPFNLFNWDPDVDKDNAAKAYELVTKGYRERIP